MTFRLNGVPRFFMLFLAIGLWQSINAQKAGILYGTTYYSGGGVFSYDPITNVQTTLFNFNSTNGYQPRGNVIQAYNGLLYGLTTAGGKGISNYGVIFSYDPLSGKAVAPFSFNDTNGANPIGSLVEDTNGILYGMTVKGGAYNQGVLFSFNPSTSKFDTILSFNGLNGSNPNGGLIQAADGLLYGLTVNGGSADDGLMFSYNPASKVYNVVTNFNGPNGENPYGSLINYNDSVILGIVSSGSGSISRGAVFSYNIHTQQQSIVYALNDSTGFTMHGDLLLASNGLLYGMTQVGGKYNNGAVFSLDYKTDSMKVLINFNNTNGNTIWGNLIQANNGLLYGLTQNGGSNNIGVLFSYNPVVSNSDSVLFNFNSSAGGDPFGSLYEAMSVTYIKTDNKCYNDSLGSAVLSVRGGKYPLKYSWSNGDSTDSVAKLAAGKYIVKVTDAAGRGVDLTITIKQPPQLRDSITSKFNEKCFGENIGSINIGLKGGTKPYTYQWMPGSVPDTSINGLAAGTYSFSLKDSNQCSSAIIATITQPAFLKDSISSFNNVLCYGLKTGNVSAGAIGGTKPYVFLWSNSIKDSVINNVGVGTYACQVKDTNGCVASVNIKITSPPAINDSTIFTSTPCTKSTGSVGVVNVTGGVYPYSYLWTPGNIEDSVDTALPSGLYSCTITDSNKCQKIVQIFVPNTGGPRDSLIAQANELCFGQNMGSASVTVKGGKKPYSFNWSPSGGNDTIATGLLAGSYIFSATDSIGCVNTTTVNISQPKQLVDSVADSMNISCFGFSNGYIRIGVKGGVMPYYYTWIGPINTADDSIAASLPVGTYSVTATDSHGCPSKLISTTLTSPALVVIDTLSSPTKCGKSTGTIQVNVSGGVTPYKYLWNVINDTNASVSGLPGGINYTCQVTDANGCTSGIHVTVADTGGPRAFIYVHTQIKCYGDSSGIAIMNVTKGVAPFKYSWTPVGGTNAFAVGLGAGIYSCIVTDSTGCKQVDSVDIDQPTRITDTIRTIGVCNSFITGGQAQIFVSGGQPPYEYLWNTKSTNDSINDVGPGAYLCSVTDSNKCKLYATCNIIPATPLKIDSIIAHASACDTCNNGWAKVYVSGGIPKGDSIYYLYVWDNAQTTDSITGLYGGMYHVCITTNYCANQTICDSTFIVSGISNLTIGEQNISVYPIPSAGEITVTLPKLGNADVKIYDALGKECVNSIVNANESSNSYKYDLSLLPNGIYILQVVDNKHTVTRKIEIER